MKRGYYIEFNEKENPFENLYNSIKDKPWDWYFEENAYEVKRETFYFYSKLLDITVKNRHIMNNTFMILTIDVPNMNPKIDNLLVSFVQGRFTRMLKSSKTIQDLTFQGNYIEAKSLLRSNFERAVLIQYFIKNIKELRDYLKAKQENNKKLLEKYTIKKLTENLKQDYEHYKYLCHYVHPYVHGEDFTLGEIGGNTFVSMTNYNDFDYKQFVWTNYMNNNILAETFFSIFRYTKAYISSKELKRDGLKIALERVKEIVFLDIKMGLGKKLISYKD